MKKLLLLPVLLLIISCSPCKYVSNHPECFPADSIITNNETIRYEKIYITEDSLIYDTIPCNPITESAINVETVYKTIWRTKIDTIIRDSQTVKINPVNTELKKSVDKLTMKIEKRKIFIWYSIGITLLIIIYLVVKFYLSKLKL